MSKRPPESESMHILYADDEPALQQLMSDPELRAGLALAGFERVRRDFSMQGGIDRLMQRLEQSFDGQGG